MSLHENDKNRQPDDLYEPGHLKHLVVGKTCRLLDGRRTEGYIEAVMIDQAIFRWRITKYEDTGNYWDVDLEKVDRFQFEKDGETLDQNQVDLLTKAIGRFDQDLCIQAGPTAYEASQLAIRETSKEVDRWLADQELDLKWDRSSQKENAQAALLLERYLEAQGLLDLEKETAEILVLNPNSGEWFKGMLMIMAEMGLVTYKGKVARTPDIFSGRGDKALRRAYIIHRMAFVRSLFKAWDLDQVTLYRGMSTEGSWENRHRDILHMTFSKDVAESFADLSLLSPYPTSYVVKMPVAVEDLFMTYVETAEMNRRYQEKEAIVVTRHTYSL